MADQELNGCLLSANGALLECDFQLRQFEGDETNGELIARARQRCDDAEKLAAADDADATATIAILRAVAATFALRHTVSFELGDVAFDFDDDDGTVLAGVEQDSLGLSRPLAEQAIEATQAALRLAPESALMRLYLGHALTWLGDRDGAVAAYTEAARLNPGDPCASSALRYLDAEPVVEPAAEPGNGQHGFAQLRLSTWIDNSEWDTSYLLFSSVADARECLDQVLLADPAGARLVRKEDDLDDDLDEDGELAEDELEDGEFDEDEEIDEDGEFDEDEEIDETEDLDEAEYLEGELEDGEIDEGEDLDEDGEFAEDEDEELDEDDLEFEDDELEDEFDDEDLDGEDTAEFDDDEDDYLDDAELDEDGEGSWPALRVYRPGQQVAEYDLDDRIQGAADGTETPDGGSTRVDWDGIPVDEAFEPSLPQGRPLRIGGRTCFFGDPGAVRI